MKLREAMFTSAPVRSVAHLTVLLLALGCDSASTTPAPDTGARPTWGAVTSEWVVPTNVTSWALNRQGQAAILYEQNSKTNLRLFNGDAWGEVTAFSDGGHWGPIVYADALNRFVYVTTYGGASISLGDPAVGTFTGLKGIGAHHAYNAFPSVNIGDDGRVQATLADSNAISVYQADAHLTKFARLGTAGSYQASDDETIDVRVATSSAGSAIYWQYASDSAQTAWHAKMNFLSPEGIFDGERSVDVGPRLLMMSVDDGGTAIALWRSGVEVLVSMRTPSSRAFGRAETIMRLSEDTTPSYAAWPEGGGRFAIVVADPTKVQRAEVDAATLSQTRASEVHVHARTAYPTLQIASQADKRLATWSATNGPRTDIMAAWITTEGWSEPSPVVENASTSAQASVGENGEALLVWWSKGASCGTPHLRHFQPSLGWGDLALPTDEACPTLTASMIEGGRIAAMWTTGSGPQTVRTAIAAR